MPVASRTMPTRATSWRAACACRYAFAGSSSRPAATSRSATASARSPGSVLSSARASGSSWSAVMPAGISSHRSLAGRRLLVGGLPVPAGRRVPEPGAARDRGAPPARDDADVLGGRNVGASSDRGCADPLAPGDQSARVRRPCAPPDRDADASRARGPDASWARDVDAARLRGAGSSPDRGADVARVRGPWLLVRLLAAGRLGLSKRPRPRGSEPDLAGPLRRFCWSPERAAGPSAADCRRGLDSERPPMSSLLAPLVRPPVGRLPARPARAPLSAPPRLGRPWLPPLAAPPAPLVRLPLAEEPSADGRLPARGRPVPLPPREPPLPVPPREPPVPVPPREPPVPVPPREPPVPVPPREPPGPPVLAARRGDVPRRFNPLFPACPARPALAPPDPGTRLGPAGRPFDSPPCRPRPFPATANSHLARSFSATTPPECQIHRKRIEGRYQHGSDPQREDVRRRPTLPRGPPRSTIGAEGLNFRVRNGTGCFPFAMATETLWRCQVLRLNAGRPHLGNRTVDAKQQNKVEAKPLGLLVPVSYTRCRASTSGLSTQSSSWGPYQVNPEGVLILRRASRLDAFSGYPFRT